MRIGIDLDGTILDMPAFFSILSHALMAEGHEVHVITYRDNRELAVRDLEASAIRYTGLHLPETMIDAREWKRARADELSLDLMIDDSPDVLAAMPPSVKRLWLCDPALYNLDKAIGGLLGECGDS